MDRGLKQTELKKSEYWQSFFFKKEWFSEYFWICFGDYLLFWAIIWRTSYKKIFVFPPCIKQCGNRLAIQLFFIHTVYAVILPHKQNKKRIYTVYNLLYNTYCSRDSVFYTHYFIFVRIKFYELLND